ncbi:ribonuclease HII [Candidatus Woesearchaeota archaeon]|nr:ribonuclease HII [Candidatus Woesearchaeota archaeon]
MVLSGILTDEEGIESLKSIGVKDSKKLTPRKRAYLFNKIIKIVKKYSILTVFPEEIDGKLNHGINLNDIEAIKSAQIINELKPDKVIIDCPSPNLKAWKNYVLELLNDKKIELIVEHKADSNHIPCAAASILSKVTRDNEIEKIKKKIGIDFGSGYPSDPITKKFLKENIDKFPEIFRKSWSTYSDQKGTKLQKSLGDF